MEAHEQINSYNSEETLKELDRKLDGLIAYQEETAKRLRRFEEGYDFQILKNFTRPLFRKIASIENKMSKCWFSWRRRALNDTLDEIIEVLERNSIIVIEPQIGEQFAGNEKLYEVVEEKKKTKKAELVGHVAKVLHRGFKYEFNDGSVRVLAPAKVMLYASKNQ